MITAEDLDIIAERTAERVVQKLGDKRQDPDAVSIIREFVDWYYGYALASGRSIHLILADAKQVIKTPASPVADSVPGACQGGNEGDDGATHGTQEISITGIAPD